MWAEAERKGKKSLSEMGVMPKVQTILNHTSVIRGRVKIF